MLILDTEMTDVPYPFTFTLNWNPRYSYSQLPEGISDIPEHWRALTHRVEPPERGLTDIRDITFAGVRARGAGRIVSAAGLPDQPIVGVHFRDVRASGKTAGRIAFARAWSWDGVTFTTEDGRPITLRNTEDVGQPEVRKAPAP